MARGEYAGSEGGTQSLQAPPLVGKQINCLQPDVVGAHEPA